MKVIHTVHYRKGEQVKERMDTWSKQLINEALESMHPSVFLISACDLLYDCRGLPWALATLFAVAYSADLCRSPLWLQIFQIECPALPTHHQSWAKVGFRLACVTVLVAGSLQGWLPLTGLQWSLLAVPCIFAGPPSTFLLH